MAEITISLPDGSQRSLPGGATAITLAESIGARLAKAAVAAVVNGDERDLGDSLPDGAQVAIITAGSDEGRHVLRHSTAHVLAQAVTQLFPGAKFSIGPAINDGFYYDFELPGGRTFAEAERSIRGKMFQQKIEARERELEGELKKQFPVTIDEATLAQVNVPGTPADPPHASASPSSSAPRR